MAVAVVAAMLAGVVLGRLAAPAGAPSPTLPSREVAVVVGDSPGITDRALRWVDGVPLGWPQTRPGAVAAAAGYAKVLSKHWFLTDSIRRRRAVAQMAAPEAAAQLQASQDALASAMARGAFGAALARPGVAWLLRTSLLGYRVDHYTPTAAEIALWALVVYGTDRGGPPPQALFATSTLRLRWAGDWKLVAASTVPGPVPLPGPATQPRPPSWSGRPAASRSRRCPGAVAAAGRWCWPLAWLADRGGRAASAGAAATPRRGAADPARRMGAAVRRRPWRADRLRPKPR